MPRLGMIIYTEPDPAVPFAILDEQGTKLAIRPIAAFRYLDSHRQGARLVFHRIHRWFYQLPPMQNYQISLKLHTS